MEALGPGPRGPVYGVDIIPLWPCYFLLALLSLGTVQVEVTDIGDILFQCGNDEGLIPLPCPCLADPFPGWAQAQGLVGVGRGAQGPGSAGLSPCPAGPRPKPVLAWAHRPWAQGWEEGGQTAHDLMGPWPGSGHMGLRPWALYHIRHRALGTKGVSELSYLP